MSHNADQNVDSQAAGIGGYISLAFAIVFFSGLCATSEWWGVFDFTTLNGSFGTLVASVTENNDAIATSMANFRGKGGSGAIDGFMFAMTLVPTVMFANTTVLCVLLVSSSPRSFVRSSVFRARPLSL